ncbi:MAG: hypothetical protein M3065_00230 [Actinomycetota bacterium]|nr:hypothetical protein [Actinomycetota bacterium]
MRRLVEGGGVRLNDTKLRLEDLDRPLRADGCVLRIGRKQRLRVSQKA